MNISERWEQGSEFHLSAYRSSAESPAPWGKTPVFFGSGQDASRSLLIHGQKERGWRRFWIPSYFCQQVVQSFISTGIEVITYPAGPGDLSLCISPDNLNQGDVVFIVNFFGLHCDPPQYSINREYVEIIEDHTHDPWSKWAYTSDADWCVVSLRKTLPIPDGGVLWSPSSHALPETPLVDETRRTASLEKFAAMALKALYLEGCSIEKDVFRNLATKGESRIAYDPVIKEISGITTWSSNLLKSFPIKEWRKKRKDNHQLLLNSLARIKWLTVLQPNMDSDDVCPFSCIILFDLPERRDSVRNMLINSCVYPSVLWSMDNPAVQGIPQENIDFSGRMLSVHCDMRYSSEDMGRVASLIIRFGDEYRSS